MHQVATKEELIARKRRWIAHYKENFYDNYLKDPDKYIEEANNTTHIKWLTEEFPKML